MYTWRRKNVVWNLVRHGPWTNTKEIEGCRVTSDAECNLQHKILLLALFSHCLFSPFVFRKTTRKMNSLCAGSQCTGCVRCSRKNFSLRIFFFSFVIGSTVIVFSFVVIFLLNWNKAGVFCSVSSVLHGPWISVTKLTEGLSRNSFILFHRLAFFVVVLFWAVADCFFLFSGLLPHK